MKRVMLVIVFVLTMIVGYPVLAQEATEVAVETPVVAVTEEVPNVVFPEVTIINEFPQEEETPQEEVVTWPSIGAMISIVVGVVALIVAFIAWRRDHPNASVAESDAKLSELIEARREDRVWMDKVEKSYQQIAESHQQIIQSLVDSLEYISTLTPVKSDDALTKLIKDIQEEGTDTPPEPPQS